MSDATKKKHKALEIPSGAGLLLCWPFFYLPIWGWAVCLLSEGFGLKEVIALLRGISFDFLVHLVRAGRLGFGW